MFENNRLTFLFAMFIALLLWMNILWVKIISIFWISVSVWIFMVPLTFLITDIVAEVYWREVVKKFIIFWVISLIIFFVYSFIFVYLEPNPRFTNEEAYDTIFWSSLRMILASLVAFMLSQLHDLFVFEKLKKKTKWKLLWLRNNVSTMISQLIDTTVFMFIAFYMVSEKFTASFIISLIIPYYIFKIIFALLDTPFVYIWVTWLRAWEHKNNNLIRNLWAKIKKLI